MNQSTVDGTGQSVRERVRRHRENLRAKGLRPIQLWVPDTRRAGFSEEARRQGELLRDDPHEKEVFDFIDAVMEGTEWN